MGGFMGLKKIKFGVKSGFYGVSSRDCKKKGLLVSRQFEICMGERLKKEGKRE